MKRRAFITLLGSAVAWPLAARGQQPERMRLIGVLEGLPEGDPVGTDRMNAVLQGLRELGWIEGRNIRLERRPATSTSTERAQMMAKELVGLKPDVILVQGTLPLLSVSRETRTIPIVFANVSDPVGDGFVESFAHPGGNITGFSQYEYTIGGKWFELLKETAPDIARVAVVMNASNPPSQIHFRTIESAATPLGMQAIPIAVHNTLEFERAIESFSATPKGGLIVVPGAANVIDRDRLLDLPARHRLPAIYADQTFASRGGLMAYGVDGVDQYRRAAAYVNRILKGEKPADLPVQQPAKYILIINLKTARTLGLTVPLPLLASADEGRGAAGPPGDRGASTRRRGRTGRMKSLCRCRRGAGLPGRRRGPASSSST